MNTLPDFTHFGFIGFGLIGGTIARSLRELYPDSEIMAYNYYENRPHPQLELAKEDGVLTYVSTELEDFSKCQVIFLCAPVITNVSYLKKIKNYISDECLITDVGSVKGNIHEAIHNLGLDKHFVGGHPMTGSEKTGYINSSSSFLKNAYYILTPTKEAPEKYTEWLRRFVTDSGSHCEIMDYKRHDDVTAAIRHGPHVISASLVNTVASLDDDEIYAKLAAGGLKDLTRISSSSPEMWQNISLTNSKCIVSFLDKYMDELKAARDIIASNDADKLTEFFTNAKSYRDKL